MTGVSGKLASPRNRIAIFVVLIVVAGLGLASRSLSGSLPVFVTAHAGDALWTVAAYLTLALVWPRWSPLRLGVAAFGVSVAVELSQLIDVAWLNAARQTLPGRLLLGSGFLWLDWLRYLAGAIVATIVDWLLTARRVAPGSRRH